MKRRLEKSEHQTFNIERSTSNVQHRTFNIERSTSNAQRRTEEAKETDRRRCLSLFGWTLDVQRSIFAFSEVLSGLVSWVLERSGLGSSS